MANRAYLFATNDATKHLNNLSEARFPIPFWYKLLMGFQVEMVPSQLWDEKEPIALRARLSPGLERLFEFGQYLQSQELPDLDLLIDFLDRTQQFFNQDRASASWLFLEAAEIYDLIPEEPVEEQNEQLLFEIQRIYVDLGKILKDKPDDIRKFSGAVWIKDLFNDWEASMDVRWSEELSYALEDQEEDF